MAAALPPNNGSAQQLKFERVRTKTMRELIATGVLNDLEFGLLKGSSKKSASAVSNDKLLGWGVEEKGVLLNMEVEELKVIQTDMELEVQVRSLCYSRGVTADYLASHERFNMKQCVLFLGDLGKGSAPWSELVQPAVYLHRKEFNIIWIEVPSWGSNPQLWMKYGGSLIRGLLKFLCVKQASVVCRGIGGAVFLEALAKAPERFARSHVIYNMDMPPGKHVQLPIFDLEEVLRNNELQLWFAFKDDELYDRFVDGSPQRAYDAVQKLQARLVGERQRGRVLKNYDEILLTENLNANPHNQHLNRFSISIYNILVFSNQFLNSIVFFLEIAPGTHQDSMEGGLVGDFRAEAHGQALEGTGKDNEPMAVRRTRIGHLHGLADRRERAFGNKKRLENVQKATSELKLALPDVQSGAYAGFSDELAKRLEDQGSDRGSQGRRGYSVGSTSRTGSKMLEGSVGSNSRGGSRAGSRAGGSRMSTKEDQLSPALPALLSSSSVPNLQALANEPANSDSEDEGLMGPAPSGQQPWQHYRRMWQDMHGKAPTGFTHPMKEI